MTEATEAADNPMRAMTSEINLQITITHEWNLPANADEIADRVARELALWLAPGSSPIVRINDRIRQSGPVRVFLRSAFVSRIS